MMYSEKFVAVIKCDGKILRDRNGVVSIPFGKEYSIFLKNLSNRNVLVRIQIDDREVTGGGLVIPHSFKNEVELERFLDDGDMDKGYKFKFIQKTKDVQEFRGDKVEDGLIKIEWWFEEEEPVSLWKFNQPYLRKSTGSPAWLASRAEESPRSVTYGMLTSNVAASNTEVYTCSASPSIGFVDFVDDSPLADEGITVEGSDSNQKFRYASIGKLEEESHIIIFQLKGVDNNKKQVEIPGYVHKKIQCKQCGHVWRGTPKFCSHCGARLVV